MINADKKIPNLELVGISLVVLIDRGSWINAKKPPIWAIPLLPLVKRTLHQAHTTPSVSVARECLALIDRMPAAILRAQPSEWHGILAEFREALAGTQGIK